MKPPFVVPPLLLLLDDNRKRQRSRPVLRARSKFPPGMHEAIEERRKRRRRRAASCGGCGRGEGGSGWRAAGGAVERRSNRGEGNEYTGDAIGPYHIPFTSQHPNWNVVLRSQVSVIFHPYRNCISE